MIYPKIPDELILNLYQEGHTNKHELAKMLGISIKTVQRSFNRLGIRHVSVFEFHLEDVWDSLVNDYLTGSTISEVCKKYDLHIMVVRPRLKDIKIYRNEQPRYQADFDFFETIDTEEKAYWLGFLMADGCVTGKCSMKLGLAATDYDMLEKFNICLKSNYPISFEPKRNERSQDQRRLTISNQKMYDDLVDKGVVPRKTMVLQFPDKVSDELIRHFIRGYSDGDGCVTGKKNGYWSITGTEQFLLSIQKILMLELGFSKTKMSQRHKNNPIIKSLLYGGNRQMTKLYHYLYDDATVFMERKKSKFETFCK